MSILLVQHASNKSTTGTSLTVTLGAAATLANCLVVCATAVPVSLSGNTTISGIKIGSSADNFAQAETEAETTDSVSSFIWTDQDIGTSSASVAITWSTSSGGAADVYEWSGVKTSSAVDKTNGANNTSKSWSSGSTGTLSQASEVAVGVNGSDSSGTNTVTGPGSPWTNEAQLTTSSGGVPLQQLSGYQVVSATTALTWSGSDSATSVANATCIATLEAASGTPHTDTASLTVTPSFTAARTRGKYRTAALAVTPSFTAARTRGKYRTAALAVTPSFTASRIQAHVRAATLAVEPSFTASRTQAHVRSASLTVDPVFTAEGQQHAGAQSRTASLTVTPVFTAAGVVNRPAPATVRYPYHHRETNR